MLYVQRFFFATLLWVGVASAASTQPLVEADWLSRNLDTENAKDLHELFLKLRDELGQSFVIVTHNNELAAMADRMIEMKDGQIINYN